MTREGDKMKEFEGIVIFLENDMGMLQPWLYRTKFFKHKLEGGWVNFEAYDNCRVKVKGRLAKKENVIDVMSVEAM